MIINTHFSLASWTQDTEQEGIVLRLGPTTYDVLSNSLQSKNLTLVAELKGRSSWYGQGLPAVRYSNHCGLASYFVGYYAEDVRYNQLALYNLANYDA